MLRNYLLREFMRVPTRIELNISGDSQECGLEVQRTSVSSKVSFLDHRLFLFKEQPTVRERHPQGSLPNHYSKDDVMNSMKRQGADSRIHERTSLCTSVTAFLVDELPGDLHSQTRKELRGPSSRG